MGFAAEFVRRAPPSFPPGFAFGWGDDRFGLWADARVLPHVVTHEAMAVQRFRWIEPGLFLMGSPSDEVERWGDEGPQHSVELSRGFWLADTACTQSLWQAAMGDNPSRFTGDDQSPVESVSWDRVQEFLVRVNARWPGVSAELPTEAEWEYACRAGSASAFWFGNNIDPSRVNYDGNYPYADGVKGEYRGRTVPVKSLPPNSWGLYQMHGNVFEWCADGTRRYTDERQVDPRGEAEELVRVVRGGSWSSLARNARSARRFADPQDFADDRIGFRFCLRSREPGTDGQLVPPGRRDARQPGGLAPEGVAARLLRRIRGKGK